MTGGWVASRAVASAGGAGSETFVTAIRRSKPTIARGSFVSMSA